MRFLAYGIVLQLMVACAKPKPPENPLPPSDETTPNSEATLQQEQSSETDDSGVVSQENESETVETVEKDRIDAEKDAFAKEEQEIRERELAEKKARDAEFALHDKVHSIAKKLWGINPSDLTSTLADIESLEAKHPDAMMIRYNKGVALYKSGKEDEAKKEFVKITKEDPSYALGWYALGQLASQNNLDRDALRFYEQGLKNNPQSFQLWAGKIDALRRMGRFDEAQSEAKSALKKNASNIGVYQALIDVNLDLGKLETADFMVLMAERRLASQGSQKDDAKKAEDYRIITSKAFIEFRRRGPNEYTKQRLIYSLSLQPNQHLARIVLGICFLADHVWDQAKKHLEIAYTKEPKNPGILNALAIANRGEQNYTKAEELYRQALKKQKNPQIGLNLGLNIAFQFRKELSEKPSKEEIENAQKTLEAQKKEVDRYIQDYEKSALKDSETLKEVQLVITTLHESEASRLLFLLPDESTDVDENQDGADSVEEDSQQNEETDPSSNTDPSENREENEENRSEETEEVQNPNSVEEAEEVQKNTEGADPKPEKEEEIQEDPAPQPKETEEEEEEEEEEEDEE